MNVYPRHLSVGLFLLGLSMLGWMVLQWHQYLHKIDVEERLTPQVREECSTYAEQRAMNKAKQERLKDPEGAYRNIKEGWYSRDDYGHDYKTCIETTPPTDESIDWLKLNRLSIEQPKTEEDAKSLRERIRLQQSLIATGNIRKYGGILGWFRGLSSEEIEQRRKWLFKD